MTTAAAGWLRDIVAALRRNALLLAIYLTAGAALTIVAGQDVNWDLLNYHFYNPFHLLNSRIVWDIDAAGVQTYMNPAFDVPFYIAVRILRLPPIVVGASLGAFHGLGLFFVHKIAVALVGGARRIVAHLAGAFCCVLAAGGAGFYSEVGGTMGDTTMAVFVFGALWLLISRAGRDGTPTLRSVAWAGLLVGMAVGGKLVAAIYVAGFGLAVTLVGRSITGRFVRGATFGLCVIGGAALTIGYWSWMMKVHFGSPTFPYLQQVIRQPTRPVAKMYLPRDTTQRTLYPFYFAFTQKPFMVSEVSFSDARMAVGYCAVGVFVLAAVGRLATRRRLLPTVEDGRLWLLMLCAIASFVVWLVELSIYRYAIPIEMLVGLLVIGSFNYLFRRGSVALLLALPVAVYLFASTRVLDWGRIEWQKSYFGMDGVDLSQYAGATIFTWEMPNAYLIPYFPTSARFIRLNSNWSRFARAPMLKPRFDWAVQGADRRKIFLLETDPGAAMEAKEHALEMLGMTLDLSECRAFASVLDPVRMCAVRVLDK